MIYNKKTDVENTNKISNRTKSFQSTVDGILSRLDTSEHREELDKLKELLDDVEKDISTLPNKVSEIDKKFEHFTNLLDTGKCDEIISLDVNEYRFKYGDLLVTFIEELDKKQQAIKKAKRKEKAEKMLIMSFVEYAKRFDNKRARLTDEANDRYVAVTSKYSDTGNNIITKEFED